MNVIVKNFGHVVPVILVISLCVLMTFPRNVSADGFSQNFYGTVKDWYGKNISAGLTIRAMIVDDVSPDTPDYSTQNYTTLIYDAGVFGSLTNNSRKLAVFSEDGTDGDSVFFYIGGFNTSEHQYFAGGHSTSLALTIEDKPRFLGNHSDTSGTTGDPFTINVTIGEYVDSGEELTVNVNWTHGTNPSFVGVNDSMSLTGGNNSVGFFFEKTIILDNYSVANLVYTVYVNDTSTNHNSSGPHIALVTDNDDPITTLDIGEPVHPDGGTNNANVTSSTLLYLNSTDNIGLFYIHYRIWNVTNGWSSLTNGTGNTNLTLTLFEEGKNYLEYYANDTANNVETTHNVTVWVDKSFPTTVLSIGSPNYPSAVDGCNVTSATTFTLAATDNPSHNSSVAFSWYTDNGAYHLYAVPFTLSGSGSHVITYGSQDYLGNNETDHTVTVWIDISAPTTTLTIGTPVYPPSATNGCNVTSATELNLSATDPAHGSGLQYIQYRYWNITDGWTTWTTYSTNFTLGNGDGKYYLEFNATDNLNNMETTNNWTIWVDNAVPTSAINNQTAGYYSYFQNSSLTITATVNISSETNGSGLMNVTLYYWYNNATTNESKVNRTWHGPFFFDGNVTPWINLTNVSWNFDFATKNGTGYYRFCSIAYDNLSNSETLLLVNETNSTECLYNNTHPNMPNTPSPSEGSTTATGVRPSSLSWTGGDVDTDNVTYTIYLRKSNSTLNATHISGYNVTNQTNVIYILPITLDWSSTYYWKIVATDEHGAITAGPIWHFTTGAETSGSSYTPPGNTAPTAEANGPYTGYVNQAITFNASGSTDDNAITGYRWDWTNDGHFDTDWLTTKTTTHAYNATETYTVKLEVKDGSDARGTDTATVTITALPAEQHPPVARTNGPYTGLTFGNITFDGSTSTDDGTITNYTWDFGDNTTGYGMTLLHQYNSSGVFNITLTVTDNDELTNTTTTTATILLDSDRDGWSDEDEILYGTDPFDASDFPLDTDGDGIPDVVDPDDDNDGLSDEIEILLGSNPKDPTDVHAIVIEGITDYIVDTNTDGIFNVFYNTQTGVHTTTQLRADGTYLIDIDGDGKWDHIYDPVAGTTTPYAEEEPGFPWLLVGGIIGLIVIIILLAIFILFKKGYLYVEETPAGEEPKEPKKKS